MNLRLRNVFFSPDGKGKGKIQDAEKGPEIEVSRENLKKQIAKGEPTIVIPVEGEKIKETVVEAEK